MGMEDPLRVGVRVLLPLSFVPGGASDRERVVQELYARRPRCRHLTHRGDYMHPSNWRVVRSKGVRPRAVNIGKIRSRACSA